MSLGFLSAPWGCWGSLGKVCFCRLQAAFSLPTRGFLDDGFSHNSEFLGLTTGNPHDHLEPEEVAC